MKKICTYCGYECDEDSIFCSNCGKKIETAEPEVVEAVETVLEEAVEKVETVEPEVVEEVETFEPKAVEPEVVEEVETFEPEVVEPELVQEIIEQAEPVETEVVMEDNNSEILPIVIEQENINENNESNETETFDGEVLSDTKLNGVQEFTEKDEQYVEKCEVKLRKKVKKEKTIAGVKTVFMVFWIIFGGLFNAIYIGISAVLECLTLFGIPFGIVLFKILPLAFNPIGKRVKTNFWKRPFFNILWIIFGGWLVALIYQIYSFILIITIIGAPIGIQMQKIATLLWAPFGSQILKENEFSDPIIEKEAYTIKYLRKNRIRITDESLVYNSAEKARYEEIYSVRKPIHMIFRTTSVAAAFSLPIMMFIFVFANRGIKLLTSILAKIFGQGAVDFINNITGKYDSFRQGAYNGYVDFATNILKALNVNISAIESSIDVIVTLLPLFIFVIVMFMIGIVSIIIANKIYKRYSYGYMTRKEIITVFDSPGRRNNGQEDRVLKLYSIYQAEVEREILNDKIEQR